MKLADGKYTVKMELSPNHPGRKQFRVYGHDKHTDTGDLGAILIHAANYPDQLAGCIGPGLSLKEGGVEDSRDAMEKIFTVFGGFKVGTTGDLIVGHITTVGPLSKVPSGSSE